MDFDKIISPTMIIDEVRVRRNISRMAEKAHSQGIHFRPHFKTHQSAVVGEWCRDYGVRSITVSSLEMANYFAAHGWDDITVAFPLNVRQMDDVRRLAGQTHLGVLVESSKTAVVLGEQIDIPLDVWVKVDSGSGRTGIDWRDQEKVLDTMRVAEQFSNISIRGLLTHAGNTYSANSIEEIRQLYNTSIQHMLLMKKSIEPVLGRELKISIGDTPGCSLSESLGDVDEIRPGNFVFYDAQMMNLGASHFEQVAAVVACPVVSLHPERDEAVIYGGAIHLSKDFLVQDGKTKYGYVVPLIPEGWGTPIQDAYVARLSQEHGVLHIPRGELHNIKVGDLIGIIPAHVCLTVSALGKYMTLNDEEIQTINCS
jgi:D-serine deaminase-like pyridoxal phosphate-dependent protein